MPEKIFNFSAGPSVLPKVVLETARKEMLSVNGIGMSVMEISHRSENFISILRSAESGLRELLEVPTDYSILFLQGGATLQFSMVPMNFLGGGSADYVVTGAWGEKAVAAAELYGKPRAIFSGKDNGYRDVPPEGAMAFDANARYIHYTSNETIEGVEFSYDLDGGRTPVVCDASSNILSKPIDLSKYDLIYAGAQKNMGPSGLTVVIVRNELMETGAANLPALLDYRQYAANESMVNTPNTWAIYILDLICKWLKQQGGVATMQRRNEAKAKILYEAIDNSDGFYSGHAAIDARSKMNVTFRMASEELDARFCSEAEAMGLDGLKGHRIVGGIRASIYNAFPEEGVPRLVDFMKDFADRNG